MHLLCKQPVKPSIATKGKQISTLNDLIEQTVLLVVCRVYSVYTHICLNCIYVWLFFPSTGWICVHVFRFLYSPMLFTFHDDKNKERFTFSSVQYIYMADLQGLRHKMIGRYILVEGYALGCKLSYTLPFLLWYSLSLCNHCCCLRPLFFHHRCDAIQCDAMVILTFINCKRFVMRLILAFGSWQYRYWYWVYIIIIWKTFSAPHKYTSHRVLYRIISHHSLSCFTWIKH